MTPMLQRGGKRQARTSAACIWQLTAWATLCLEQGRDANRRLQRAIKAGKAREGLPLLVQGLRLQLEGWTDDHGCPFLLDGRDYRVCASLCGLCTLRRGTSCGRSIMPVHARVVQCSRTDNLRRRCLRRQQGSRSHSQRSAYSNTLPKASQGLEALLAQCPCRAGSLVRAAPGGHRRRAFPHLHRQVPHF